MEENLFEWDESYKSGFIEIDLQHIFLLELIKRIAISIDSEISIELTKDYLNEILLFARFHFCSEENFMKSMAFSGIEEHQKKHDGLIHLFSNAIMRFNMDEINTKELIVFLNEWFLEDINEDIKKH